MKVTVLKSYISRKSGRKVHEGQTLEYPAKIANKLEKMGYIEKLPETKKPATKTRVTKVTEEATEEVTEEVSE